MQIRARRRAERPNLRAPTGPAARTASHARLAVLPRLSPAERALLRRQAPMTRAGDLIRNAAGPVGKGNGYAGIEFRGDIVQVWWRGHVPARVAAAIGKARTFARVEVRPAAHSLAELLAASDRLWAADGLPHGGPLIGIRLPFDGSGLTAGVAAGRAATFRAADLPRVGVPVGVTGMGPVTLTDTRCSDSAPFWGGGAIYNVTVGGTRSPCGGNSNTQYGCTAGFAVTYGGNTYLTTAGHCGSVGDVFRTPAGTTIGTMVYRDRQHDLALIKTSSAGWVWNGFPDVSDFAEPVYGWGNAFGNQILCLSGATSGVICGDTVKGAYGPLSVEDIRGNLYTVYGLIYMTNLPDGPFSQKGDSGGSVFQLDGTGSKDLAVGSITGAVGDSENLRVTDELFAPFGTATQDWSGLNTLTASGDLFPPAVTVLHNNTTSCPGTQQYFSTHDGNGVPIDWTYANGSYQCVQVSYTPTYTSASCSFDFYVPNADATGNVDFKVAYTVNGNPHSATYVLNENPVSGFTHVFTLANVVSVTFGDNDGQKGTQIGWGSNVAASLRQTC
jgi:streptogrisin D